MAENIALLGLLCVSSLWSIYKGIVAIKEYDRAFGEFLILLGLICFCAGTLVAGRIGKINSSQGTYEYKDRTYTVYTNGYYETYDVDVVTDNVKGTGLTKDEFEQLLKDKDFTERGK